MDKILRDAQSGDPYACLGVAYYYHTGKDLDQDNELAVRWYRRAATLGCPRAHWEMAMIYRDGDIVMRDLIKYIDHLKKAAELGNTYAQMELANEYRLGYILEEDLELSYYWYRMAAENGEPRAKFFTGYYSAHGIGVPRSRTEAEAWYSSVSLSADSELFLQFGMNYEYGLNGIVHNEVEAARWYKYGAERGHDKCILCLESINVGLKGGTKESYEVRMHRLNTSESSKEIRMCNDALEIADSCFDAGDEAKAFTYYERAASLGNPRAMFTIAMMYHLGIYVRRNDKKALDILRRAAAAGSEDAHFYLGRMYEDGKLPKDTEQAINHFTHAAINGFLPALYHLSKYMDHPEVHVRKTRIGRR